MKLKALNATVNRWVAEAQSLIELDCLQLRIAAAQHIDKAQPRPSRVRRTRVRARCPWPLVGVVSSDRGRTAVDVPHCYLPCAVRCCLQGRRRPYVTTRGPRLAATAASAPAAIFPKDRERPAAVRALNRTAAPAHHWHWRTRHCTSPTTHTRHSTWASAGNRVSPLSHQAHSLHRQRDESPTRRRTGHAAVAPRVRQDDARLTSIATARPAPARYVLTPADIASRRRPAFVRHPAVPTRPDGMGAVVAADAQRHGADARTGVGATHALPRRRPLKPAPGCDQWWKLTLPNTSDYTLQIRINLEIRIAKDEPLNIVTWFVRGRNEINSKSWLDRDRLKDELKKIEFFNFPFLIIFDNTNIHIEYKSKLWSTFSRIDEQDCARYIFIE